ncbi:MAG: DUF92 domain-containing protein [Candidatus Thermoplasmatota archaeon]|nr:DUF92 domain-containing protein [Candidatus Thermoplasmatota archaeon]MCL5730777.1 DUF92 domain-containing protein [Candidatus Thermoplasmatota archaeon]
MYFYLATLSITLALFFLLALYFRFLDIYGSIGALLIGFYVGILGGFPWLIIMLVFAVTSYLATIAWIRAKKDRNLQEGKNGERRFSNVISAGLTGLILVFFNALNTYFFKSDFNFFLLFAISFAVIEADTFASEIGFVDQKVYMITTGKRVERGINGGISITGTVASLSGALIIAASYSILTWSFSPVVDVGIVLMGGLGSVIDSFLGAVFENRNRMTKYQVNFSASFITVVIAAVILLI